MLESSSKFQAVCILLAAGFSRRYCLGSTDSNRQDDFAFYNKNKLIDRLPNGKSVLQQSLSNIKNRCERLLIVVNSKVESTREHLLALHFPASAILECPSRGLGESIAQGVKYSKNSQGWLIFLADMPYIPQSLLDNLNEEISQHPNSIIRPLFRDDSHSKPGHPVYFPACFYNELCELQGEMGAKTVIERHNHCLRYLECTSNEAAWDIDFHKDLAQKLK